jgi:tetratricopeptide (TPR) repeat protein
MPSHAVACPQCHASLRSNRPLPEKRTLRCPQCGTYFVASTSAPKAAAEAGNGKAAENAATEVTAAAPAAAPSSPVVLVQAPSEALGPGARLRPWWPVAASLVIVVAGGVTVGALLRSREPAAAPPAAPQDDGLVELRQQLEGERKKLEEERAQLAAQRQRLELDRLMDRGGSAMAKQHFEEAEQAYKAALKLFPQDAGALAGLTDAKTSLRAAQRDREDKEKRHGEVQRLQGEAREAMARKQYAQAVRALEGARQLAPGEPAVNKALAEAQAALDKDAAEQKRLAEYRAHRDAAQAALDAQRYTDAVREALAAQQVIPADGDAVTIQRAAEARLAAVQDQEKRKSAHKDLVDRAATALQARHFADAVGMLSSALKLFPDDKTTQKALKAARMARAEAKETYDGLMAQADAAFQANRVAQANRLYQQASEVLPGEPAAQRGLQATNAVLDATLTGRAAYARFMTQGVDALKAQRFADAARAFREALRVVPGDPDAVQGLRDAEAGQGPAARKQNDFDRAMQAGAAAVRQRQYADAIRAYGDALKLQPDNADAQAGLHKAKYGQAMANGQQALLARRIQDAIDAFEEALKEQPNDVAATAALRQARALKK